MSALLTRAAILAAADLPREEVEVPEWGGKVLVRGMSGAERDRLEAEAYAASKAGASLPANIRARRAAASIVDETGKPLFGEADIELLAAKSQLALDRVIAVARRLSAEDLPDLDTARGKLTARPERRFYFRLALALGRTVDELLATISSRELTEWMAYFEAEPFGEGRADDRARLVASLLYNANRSKNAPVLGPGDFLTITASSPPAETVDERRARVARALEARMDKLTGR